MPEIAGPLRQVQDWIELARTSGEPEHDAMTLATATPDGRPSARIVLCRGVDARGLRFFTNYESRKGHELGANPRAALVFHWPNLNRQVRIEGSVERLPPRESDEYFEQRPRGHRLSAHASPQSQPIESLETVRRRMAEATARFEGHDVPRPQDWGGFLLRPTSVEFWIRGADRVHERVRHDRVGEAWSVTRLAP